MSFGLQLLNSNGQVISDSTKITAQLGGSFTVTSHTNGNDVYFDIPNFPAGHVAWCYPISYSSFLISGAVGVYPPVPGRIFYRINNTGIPDINIDIFYGWT